MPFDLGDNNDYLGRMNPFASWILVVLLAIASPEKRDEYQKQVLQTTPAMQARIGLPESRETKEQGEERYKQIAIDLAKVIESEKLLFGGKNGHIWTAATMLAFGKMESGFRRDIDIGKGKWSKGDYGRSWCSFQLQMKAKSKDAKPTVQIDHPEMGTWTGEDVTSDRKKCFRAALEIMRRSIGACQTGTNAAGETVALDMRDRFSGFTKGRCEENNHESRVRWNVASKIFDRFSKQAPPRHGTKETPLPAPSPPAPAMPPAPLDPFLPATSFSRAHEHFAYHRSP